MKFTACLVLAVCLAVIATVSGLPAKNGQIQNNQHNKKKPPPKCIEVCTTQYTPVCAHDESGNPPMSFGSECVMRKYNCESAKKYAKKSDGECPGSTGIRLA
uniref:Kazal-like domain-containing protein n=1 Tax=Cacopsylla melanoneura TaxID=428564 RepID=A0A8D8QXC3_9HEMI